MTHKEAEKNIKQKFVIEKSTDACKGLEKPLAEDQDLSDFLPMMVMTSTTFLLRLDPIYSWIVFFVMLSFVINRTKKSLMNQTTITTVMCLISIFFRYRNIMAGVSPIPEKWTSKYFTFFHE